ncbi:hypothetical protein PHYBOEH_010758 [Phytophthora boehmeriae]|uniref:Uncharacterized protein n=1 Tax=Phytophthora boehmeriae TaxID=109152 RepID=A0A8T1X3I6_9STRA|nr:hypothetical protein PHYBOEH_010758 [Phytophthora boehmeriae]
MDRNIALTNGSTKPKAATGAASSPSRTTAPAASTAMSPVFPPIKKTKKTLSPKRLVRTGQLGKVSLPKVSSITFSAGYGSQPELEVLKCILVREGYLQRLGRASAAGHVSGAHLGETVDLLDLIRLATLETVEAIVVWRKQKQKATTEMPDKSSEPFRWNGINYLLKLPSDLEFLGKHAGLTEWLGFTLERNPFVLPLNLDCRAKFLTEPKQALQSDAWRNTDDSIRFVQVGGKRSQVSGRESLGDTNVNAGAAEALSLALAERRRAKTPYETRVVNDEELVPTTPSKINALRSKARVPARVGRTSYSSILPSQIGDVDLARIHEAEAVVLHEESMFGRYARDYQGRVVPEDEAQRRIGMVELSGNAYNTPTSLSSSYTAENLENDAVRLADPVHSDVPGKLHAKKRSGMLGPISKPEWRSFERPPPPRRRARGAQLEETLVAERKANSQLGVLVDRLREETERKAMDIAYFESCSELQVFNEELQTFTSQALRELALLRRDLQEKQYVYESKIVNIQKKEEIFNTFKLQHKAIKDANHVKRIEISKRQATNVSSLHQEQQRREDQDQAEIRAHAEAEHREHEQAAPLVQHFCATQIQKIARGMLARELYAQLKIDKAVLT